MPNVSDEKNEKLTVLKMGRSNQAGLQGIHRKDLFWPTNSSNKEPPFASTVRLRAFLFPVVPTLVQHTCTYTLHCCVWITAEGVNRQSFSKCTLLPHLCYWTLRLGSSERVTRMSSVTIVLESLTSCKNGYTWEYFSARLDVSSWNWGLVGCDTGHRKPRGLGNGPTSTLSMSTKLRLRATH